ncbi:hypothetical protein FB451DRAFT_1183337 [Mycena latifolia]|nr:hypothetical protein FB451DRAFT_1183337 [Mycena latifolia]
MNAGGNWWIPICPVVHNAIQCTSIPIITGGHRRPPANFPAAGILLLLATFGVFNSSEWFRPKESRGKGMDGKIEFIWQRSSLINKVKSQRVRFEPPNFDQTPHE